MSEALEGLRSGCWRAMGLGFGGGIDMLARSTSPRLVPGSAERPLRLVVGDEAPESEWDPWRDLVLSALVVRVRGSIWGGWTDVTRRTWRFEDLLFGWRANALQVLHACLRLGKK